jgi:hypothetical protein
MNDKLAESKAARFSTVTEFDMFGEIVHDPHGSLLGDEFIIPPFSVLNAREGWWQERKRKWLALGIQSELGRGIENLGMAHPETTSTIDFYARKRALEAEHGRQLSKDEAAALMGGALKNARAANAARLADG